MRWRTVQRRRTADHTASRLGPEHPEHCKSPGNESKRYMAQSSEDPRKAPSQMHLSAIWQSSSCMQGAQQVETLLRTNLAKISELGKSARETSLFARTMGTSAWSYIEH